MTKPTSDPPFDAFVEACTYPGVLDEARVTATLEQYLKALGVTRRVERLRRGWRLEDHPVLERTIAAILKDFAKRSPQVARDARDARAARGPRASDRLRCLLFFGVGR